MPAAVPRWPRYVAVVKQAPLSCWDRKRGQRHRAPLDGVGSRKPQRDTRTPSPPVGLGRSPHTATDISSPEPPPATLEARDRSRGPPRPRAVVRAVPTGGQILSRSDRRRGLGSRPAAGHVRTRPTRSPRSWPTAGSRRTGGTGDRSGQHAATPRHQQVP